LHRRGIELLRTSQETDWFQLVAVWLKIITVLQNGATRARREMTVSLAVVPNSAEFQENRKREVLSSCHGDIFIHS